MSQFQMNELSQPTQAVLTATGITDFSEIQTKSIPVLLAERDLIAQAPTGAGKTAAYLIPLIEHLTLQTSKRHFAQALILVPTRELALQVANQARRFLANREGFRTAVLTGGEAMNLQARNFSRGADLVVGTPARILDHLRRHTLKPSECHTLVLDEADVMLSMGFKEDVEAVAKQLPEHQTALFSATFEANVKQLSESVCQSPVFIKVQEEKFLKQRIQVQYAKIQESSKPELLEQILKNHTNDKVLVFCNTRKTCDFVCGILKNKNLVAMPLHSDLDMDMRKTILKGFRAGRILTLIATDVASRGLDLEQMNLVVCYDAPQAEQDLIHRLGRTGRGQQDGTAIVFLKPEEVGKWKPILNRYANETCTEYTHPFTNSKGERHGNSRR